MNSMDVVTAGSFWAGLNPADARFADFLNALPAAVYATDADGKVIFCNRAAAELAGRKPRLGEDQWCVSGRLFHPNGTPMRHDECPMAIALKERRPVRGVEILVERPDGIRIPVLPSPTPVFGPSGELVGAVNLLVDISDRRQSEATLRSNAQHFDHLNRIAKALSREVDLERIVQIVTDSARELSGAKFGAFFFNVTDEDGERYVLYALSGAPREAFERFGLPRNTAIFDPTFRGSGIVRSDDIRKDPRYGQSAPHFGMPKGHLPVVSYLAVPVTSPTGEVHGGLFFGHDEPGVFTNEAEEIVAGIAAHAAIAFDNAALRQSAQREIDQRRDAEQAARQLAAIVEGSDDAIISKDLNGVIMSWNRGAERVFGYTPDDIIGKPVTVLIPADRQNEEPGILERIRRGERIDHYETIRRRKNGELIDISLSVSPVRDQEGRIVGASKIARDVTERKKIEKERDLLVAELSHRVKNTLATVISIAQQSFSKDAPMQDVRQSFEGRIRGLAQTHGRLADMNWSGVRLDSLVAGELSPYRRDDGSNVRVSGPDILLGAKSAVTLGMAFHELATNAAKYGALSTGSGIVNVEWNVTPADQRLHIRWIESGGPEVSPPTRRGFGRLLLERALVSDLRGDVEMTFGRDGLTCSIDVPLGQSRL